MNNLLGSITWIEILPKDCIDCIRVWLTKHDFETTMFNLLIATNTQRKWISECSDMENLFNEGTHLRHQYPNYISSYRVDVPWTASLDNIYMYFLQYYYVPLVDNIPLNQLEHAFKNHEKYYHSKSDIFQKLWQFIESEIATLHQIINQIKTRYKNTVAIPNEFLSRGSYPTLMWTDTKNAFSRYIMEDAMISHTRSVMQQFLQKILYHCGHLRTVRYNVGEYKRALYRIEY